MHHIRLTVEYDGTNFHGWQWQPGLRTIQGELTRVLETVLRSRIERLTASGRTDAGVHACAQVVSFACDCGTQQPPDMRRLARAVSSILRGDLAVLDAAIVSAQFDARRTPHHKQYRYEIINRPAPNVLSRQRAWHVHQRLDLEKMAHAAAELKGTFDFTSFRGADCAAESAVREIIESKLEYADERVTYKVVGRGFLKHMVRNIVGTLVDIGRGRLKVNSILEIVAAADRSKAGVMAPPHGLYLDWVRYSECA